MYSIFMPNCKKCDSYFPYRILVEGELKRIINRKYCLDCHPFGAKRTRLLYDENATYEKLEYKKLTCTICSRIYDYHHKDSKGHNKTKCNSCLVNNRRHKLKKKSIEYKGGKCEQCGYSKCNRALSFHHKDPKEKDFQISGKHCYAWDRIKAELDKCILLCSNCHAEEHDRLDQKENE